MFSCSKCYRDSEEASPISSTPLSSSSQAEAGRFPHPVEAGQQHHPCSNCEAEVGAALPCQVVLINMGLS